MTWSDAAATAAQQRANQCTKQHESQSTFGENLFWGTAGAYSPQFVVKRWYDEIGSYNFSAPGYSSATGHFTQVVWSGSTQLGCAKATGCDQDYWAL